MPNGRNRGSRWGVRMEGRFLRLREELQCCRWGLRPSPGLWTEGRPVTSPPAPTYGHNKPSTSILCSHILFKADMKPGSVWPNALHVKTTKNDVEKSHAGLGPAGVARVSPGLCFRLSHFYVLVRDRDALVHEGSLRPSELLPWTAGQEPWPHAGGSQAARTQPSPRTHLGSGGLKQARPLAQPRAWGSLLCPRVWQGWRGLDGQALLISPCQTQSSSCSPNGPNEICRLDRPYALEIGIQVQRLYQEEIRKRVLDTQK